VGIGGGVGIVLAGPIVDHLDYHWLFWIPLLAIVPATIVTMVVIPESPIRTPGKVDIVGGVLCVLGLAGPVFALIEEPRRGWGDPLILLTFFGGIAVFAVFIRWERRTPQPMLPLRLFERRNFSFANIETLTVYAGLSTLTFFLVLYLQQIVGYSALKSGFALIPITIVMFFLSPRV